MSTLNAASRKFVRDAMIVAVATSALFATVNGTFSNSADAANSSSISNQSQFTYITIASGQTLWSLANKYAPEQDPRDWIANVVAFNGLTSADVHPGQRVAIAE
jgi:LysM repeat protein